MNGQPPASAPPPRPRRRWGRRILWGLLALLGLVLLLVGGVLVYLTRPSGEKRVRDKVLQAANEQLSGRVELGGVDLSLGRLVLTDVKLYTPAPENALVAEVARVEAHLTLGALVRQQVDISSASLEKPRLYLVQDARGLNLSRALEPRTPKPEEPGQQTRGKLRVDVRQLQLTDGYVEFEQDTGDTVRRVQLEGLNANGHAAYAAATQAWDAAVDATASLDEPVKGPVKLSLQGKGQETALSGDVKLEAAGLELDASASLPNPDEKQVEVRRLVVPPRLARAFVPSYPVQVPVTAQGTGGMSGNVARVDLGARAGSATLDVKGSFNLATLRSDGLTAKARDVNLEELMENGPPTSLSADLKAHGGGTSLETLDGAVDLTVSPSKFKEQPLGPVELSASAKDGHFLLSRLRALVPGASLEAHGGGTLEDLRVTGSLTAGNLATLARTLGKLGPGEPLPLAGSGSLEFVVTGPPRTPAVTLSGGFATLSYADTRLEHLSLKAHVPDVTRPFTTDATLLVDRVRTGGRTFNDVAATVTTDAHRSLEATVRVQGDAQLALTLGGTVDPSGKGLAVQSLTLAYPEATWTLQHPTHLGFENGVEVTPPLALASGPQSLSLGLVMREERVDARADVRALDLSKLPHLFVPESLGLGGVLTGSVVARGKLPRPDADVDLTLKDGRFQEYEGVDLGLKGRYLKDRASGTFRANLPGASATADFDVPVQGLLRHRREPMNLQVRLTNLDIANVMKALGKPVPYSGQLSGQLTVTGLVREPNVALTLHGQALRQEGPSAVNLPRPLAFELRGGTDAQDGTLGAHLSVQGIGSSAEVALKTHFTAGQLLLQPPTPAQVLEAPVDLQAHLDNVPLSLLSEAAQKPMAGTVTMRLNASGSVLLPSGELVLDARGVRVDGTPPLDGKLTVAAQGQQVRADLVTQRQDAQLLQVSAVLDAPLAALQDREVIGHVPFQLRGRAGPVALSELPLPGRVDPTKGLQGVLSLELSAAGTMEEPRVNFIGGLQKLGVGPLALGQASVLYHYDSARNTLNAQLTAPGGGTLLLDGTATADLSVPEVRWLDVNHIPMEATLVARDFDMGFLSGATESVRTLGGVLRADVRASGTTKSPKLKGNVQWMNGRLALMGLGEYRDIQLDLDGTEERVQLKKLFAHAGSGELNATADAVLTRGGGFSLTGQAQAQSFPVVVNDQLLAITTLRAQLEGDVTHKLVHVRNLSIPEAHIELPEVRRKDLQDLDRPTDIVVVRNGVPVERRRRKKELQQAGKTQEEPSSVKTAEGKPLESSRPPPKDAEAPKGSETGTGGSATASNAPAEPSENEAPPIRYVVNVNAPRNLWVRGSDVNVELGLSEGFTIEYDEESRLYGQVFVLRGRVDVLGRRFDVQRNSQVSFTGPALTPYINVTAEHRNERENVTVFVTIRGQGKDITIKPTSDPPLPETEIYTLLATGRRTLKPGSGASMTGTQQAASIVGSLVASQARKAISEKLPLDVFSIEAVEGGLAGARLELGTYVTDKIYVGYTGRVGATPQKGENANAVRLEYQFSPRWGTEAQCGDAPACTFDLIWSKEY